MSSDTNLKVVLCWHMHQPEYRDALDGQYRLPWTYLHAIKDYVDMAAILEEIPQGRAVVNFVPILLEQLEAYSQQINQHLTTQAAIGDPLLDALVSEQFTLEYPGRQQLVQTCLKANHERLIKPYPPYLELVEMAEQALVSAERLCYLSDQFMADIVTWYHLAWLGETIRRNDERVQRLIEQGRFFSLEDRRLLLEIIGEQVSSIVPRYRELAQNGQVELSMTPYAHPIIPLLIDFASSREALPESPLPAAAEYPGGLERSHWHVQYGIEVFEHYFGRRPRGCWPAEGGVSTALLQLLAEYHFDWIATGEAVLHNSLAHAGLPPSPVIGEYLHRPYRVIPDGPVCFFRDDGLSDLIGFTYSDWHGDDAVNNLIHHLENIAEECKDREQRVVSIILDGENAWESYPDNAYHFLTALYQRLATHPALELTTFSDSLDKGIRPGEIPALVAGSWVYGTFSTWIGDQDKNTGWDLLCQAKQAYDHVVNSQSLSAAQLSKLRRQLAICEGSDWFWWFGDYNPATSVSDFEQLYRHHLQALYKLLEIPPPAILEKVISSGGGEPAQGGVMRKGKAGQS